MPTRGYGPPPFSTGLTLASFSPSSGGASAIKTMCAATSAGDHTSAASRTSSQRTRPAAGATRAGRRTSTGARCEATADLLAGRRDGALDNRGDHLDPDQTSRNARFGLRLMSRLPWRRLR